MKTSFCYAFEELSEDLPRPPKAALRAMFSAGILVSPRGWKQVRNETRQALALEGTKEKVNREMVGELLKEAPPGQIRLVSKAADPSSDTVPAPLANALGPMRTINSVEWASLRSLDRYVLASLAANTRLLWKALDEMARTPGSKLSKRVVEPWSGSLARCELVMRADAIDRLMSPALLGGRAFVLARAAGVRAARRVSDTFDLQVDTVAGPAELDWTQDKKSGALLWQAHVSTWDGEFFPAASLVAVSTAAIALFDMAKELDPRGRIGMASIAEEPWQVGGNDREEATAVYCSLPIVDSPMHSADRDGAVSDPQRSPAPDPSPYSQVESTPRPPPNVVVKEPTAPESSREPKAVDKPWTPRNFMMMLLVSMVVVAVVSTILSVAVVRMLMK
jgi:molybdenum cofactor biosynthesis enzyme